MVVETLLFISWTTFRLFSAGLVRHTGSNIAQETLGGEIVNLTSQRSAIARQVNASGRSNSS